MDLTEQINANYEQIMASINSSDNPKKGKADPTPEETDAALDEIVASMEEHPERIPQLEAQPPLSELSPDIRAILFYHVLDKNYDKHHDGGNYSKAMNCAEAQLYYSSSLAHQVLTMNRMRDLYVEKKLVSVSGSNYQASGLLGSLKAGLEELKALKEKSRGSFGGLLGNLIVLALFLAVGAALWFYPPVHNWMMTYLPGAFVVIAAIICIVTFFSSGSFLAAGAVVFLFALLAAGYTKLIPEHLQLPIGVYGTKGLLSLGLLFLAWLLLSDSFRRNWRAVTHGRERNASKQQYREKYGQLSKHISTMEARIKEAKKHLRDKDGEYTEIMAVFDEAQKKQFTTDFDVTLAAVTAYYSKARSELKELGTL